MEHSLALELRRELEGSGAEISYLGSEKYHENLKSWSETCEKEAVCLPTLRLHGPHAELSYAAGSNCQRHVN